MCKDSELIIGIVRPLGTNSSEVIDCIRDSLSWFNYTTRFIKVSKEILSDFAEQKVFVKEYDRINYYMDLGNHIRKETKDSAILMKGVSKYIYKNYHTEGKNPSSRVAYIVESIKHPDEVDFLRRTYGDGFHLIGISDSYDNRKKHLVTRKHMPTKKAIELLERDDNDKEKNGQHTRDAYQQADYFINAGAGRMEIEASVFRLLDLLFGASFITPTFEEYAMFRAYVASLRSADLSRQIGAVVATQNQEIIAEGVNDCPKAFGGLYWPYYKNGEFYDVEGGRDYTLKYDTNKKEQAGLIENILDSLELEKTEENIKKVKSAGIGGLTEFGRVVHSEMEALMMCARNNISARGCEMYVTTFPCHNCAKHIIAAGIKRVVYIEPYPKSKALEFYKIEISHNPDVDEQRNEEKVVFEPFTGVGPHRFIDLFSMNSTKWYTRKRKDENGNIVPWTREEASLRNPMKLLNYIEMEQSAYVQYKEEIQGIRKEKENESDEGSDFN